MKLPRIKLNKTWLVLGAALFIGLIAASAARSYLANQMAALEARNRGEKVEVVVAKKDMHSGEILGADTVAVRAIPIEYAHSAALTPADVERFNGKALSLAAKRGEMIVWSMLEGKKAPTFSARVGSGRRAISVPVDEINSISGLLEPNDLIDLMVTVNQNNTKFTVPLLQTVKVLATGQRSVDDPKSGERRQYSTVTLDVSPEEAQNVIVAREAGRITALLRNPGDNQALQASGSHLASMLGLRPEAALKRDQPPEAARQIPVLYGGRSARLPADGLQLGVHGQSAAATTPAIPDGSMSDAPAPSIALPPHESAPAPRVPTNPRSLAVPGSRQP